MVCGNNGRSALGEYRYIIYIFYDDIIMIITTMQVHILYNTVWVILFVVAASLLLYKTAVHCTFYMSAFFVRNVQPNS